MNKKTPLVIKILSGPYSNNFLELPDKQKLSIGGNIQADIIIQPDAETPPYCEMTINDNDAIFSYFSQAAFNNSNELLIPQVRYPLPLFFTLKEIKLAIGTEEQLEQPSDLLQDDVDELQLEDLTKIYRLKMKLAELFPSKQHKYIAICISSLILLLMIILISFAIRNSTSNSSYKKNVRNQQQIKQLFFNLPSKYSNLSINTTPDGKIEVYGLINDEKQNLYLSTYFKDYKASVKFDLVTIPQALAKVKQIIAQSNLNNLIATVNPSTLQLQLSGLITSPDKLNDLEILISNEIPEISSINADQVFDISQFDSDLSAITDLFPQRLTVNHTGKQLDISGYLTDSEKQLFEAKIASFKQKYQTIVTVNTKIQDLLSILPFKIYTIYNGDHPYLVTSDGNKVFVGGTIDGFTLSNITDQQITLKGKFTIILNIMQIMNNNVSTCNNPNTSDPSKNCTANVSATNAPTKALDSRSQIIQNELDKEKLSLAKEQTQVTKLNAIALHIKDKDLKNSMLQQVNDLQQDIQIKQHELDNYYRSLNDSNTH